MLQVLEKSLRRDWPSYLVIALGIAIQVFLITRPIDFLVANLLPDDAFYYFEIARHIAAGQGSTFDGIHPTNGYHPLWLLVLVPLFSLLSVGGTFDITPVYGALALSVFINALTAVALLRLVAKVTEHRLARAFALLLWCLNPFVIYESLNGLETSLALCLTSCFFLAAVHVETHDRLRYYAGIGILGGLMILARIDLIFYFAAFLAWILLRHGLREGLRRAFIAGVPALLALLPWLAFNLTQFGMLLTSASSANPMVNHTLTALDNGTSLAAMTKAVAYMLVTYGQDVLVRMGVPWLLFICAGAVLVSDARHEVKRVLRPATVPVIAVLFAGFTALFLANAGIRFTGRTWYFISANIFLVLAGAYFIHLLCSLYRRTGVVLSVLVVMVLSSFSIGWYDTLRDTMASQKGMLAAATWMNEHLPEGTAVGVFNAGIEGYFSHARIVNLDGLVNNSAYDALRERRLWSYMQEEGITYLADFDIYIDYRYHSFFGHDALRDDLTEVVRIPVEDAIHGVNEIGIYSVPPRGR